MKNIFGVMLTVFLASHNAHACSVQAFVSDSILNTQTQVNPGGTFTAHCNYGVASNSVTVSFTGGSCVLAGWIGTNGHFLCTAGSAPGNYTVSCNIGSPYCSQSKTISGMQVLGTSTPASTPALSPVLAPSVATGGAGWNLTFSDEFNGSSLNTSVWATNIGGHQCLPQNKELQVYEPNAFSETGGILNILTTKTPTVSTSTCVGPYVSGAINTINSFNQLYGYFEMRAKIPSGQGFWPAFWLMAQNPSLSTNATDEIDVMEMLNTATTQVHQSYHWSYVPNLYITNGYTSPVDCSQNFCVFAVDWEPGTISWYVNGVKTYTYSSSTVPNVSLYMIANLAVGGFWGGDPNSSTVFPNKMQLDYIRVYQKASSGACYASIPTPSNPIPSKTCVK